MKAIKEILGVVFGILLFCVSLIVLRIITFIFFSEKYTINGTVVTKVKVPDIIYEWIVLALLIFLIIFGHYLIYSRTESDIEKTRDIKIMKATLMGFSIWLIIIIVTYFLKINISHSINIGRGLITIFFVYLLTRNKDFK